MLLTYLKFLYIEWKIKINLLFPYSICYYTIYIWSYIFILVTAYLLNLCLSSMRQEICCLFNALCLIPDINLLYVGTQYLLINMSVNNFSDGAELCMDYPLSALKVWFIPMVQSYFINLYKWWTFQFSKLGESWPYLKGIMID